TAVRARVVVALPAASGLPAHAQCSPLPGVVHLDADAAPDGTVVQVRNEGDRVLQRRMYLSDYDQAESGEYALQAPGSGPGSCAGRLSFFPDNAVLAPGEQQEVQVRVESGSACWALLFVES